MLNLLIFTEMEQISLAKEIAVIGSTIYTIYVYVNGTKRNVEKSTFYHLHMERKTLDKTDDLSAVEGSDDIVFYETARAELNHILENLQEGAFNFRYCNAWKSTQLQKK